MSERPDLIYRDSASGVWMMRNLPFCSAARDLACRVMDALELDATNDFRTRDKIIDAIADQLNAMLNQERRKLTAGGEPSIVRRQFPDGSVPETLQECAEGWKRHYDRMLDDWNVMRQQRDNALEAEVRALNSIQAMHRDEPFANVSALAAALCRKHNEADSVAVWEIHDVEALIRKRYSH